MRGNVGRVGMRKTLRDRREPPQFSPVSSGVPRRSRAGPEARRGHTAMTQTCEEEDPERPLKSWNNGNGGGHRGRAGAWPGTRGAVRPWEAAPRLEATRPRACAAAGVRGPHSTYEGASRIPEPAPPPPRGPWPRAANFEHKVSTDRLCLFSLLITKYCFKSQIEPSLHLISWLSLCLGLGNGGRSCVFPVVQ